MADVFQILADPTRRRLLESLREGDRSVNELVRVSKISQPGVSKQLRILHEAGLVVAHRDGRQRIYSLRAEPLRSAAEWLRFYERHWEDRLDALETMFQREPKKGGSKR